MSFIPVPSHIFLFDITCGHLIYKNFPKWGNQNPSIEENGQKEKQRFTKHYTEK